MIQGTNTYPISLIGWTIRTYFIFGWLLLNNKCVRKNFAICHGCCWQKSGGEARVPLLPLIACRCPYLHILSHKKKLSNSTSFVTILMNSTTTKKRGLSSAACVYVVCKQMFCSCSIHTHSVKITEIYPHSVFGKNFVNATLLRFSFLLNSYLI